jgi:phosphoserine phosphatase
LSAIEGIDELAHQNNVGAEVAAMTAKAMSLTGINPEIYRERLLLTAPTRQQVLNLGELYCNHVVPDAKEIIEILLRLNKQVFIASAGLKPAVSLFGESLQIPPQNIFAVDIEFDSDGKYINFDAASPLTRGNGKREIAHHLIQQFQRVAHIGDGMNDLVVRDLVTRFIGYGGIYYRAHIESDCEYYLRAKSLAGLLPLLLTQKEAESLQSKDHNLYIKGLGDLTLA